MSHSEFNNRITELEIRLTHNEDTLEQLNQIIISQRNEINILQIQIDYLGKKLKLSQASPLADEKDETPPPHY